VFATLLLVLTYSTRHLPLSYNLAERRVSGYLSVTRDEVITDAFNVLAPAAVGVLGGGGLRKGGIVGMRQVRNGRLERRLRIDD